MPIQPDSAERQRHRVIRRVLGVRGTLRLRMECAPAFDYGRTSHETVIGEHGATFHTRDLSLSLTSPVQLHRGEHGVLADFELSAGETVTFILERVTLGHLNDSPIEPGEAAAAFEDTLAFWRRWLSTSDYRGRWREMVHRSALVLKLLTYAPTGAIVAAPTASLPEVIGGGRNWDYRYTWVRDAAFSVHALLRLGFTEEAAAFMDWLEARARESRGGPNGPLQIMYGIDGRHEIPEHDARPSRRLSRVQAGAHRQRRRRPAPARHLRRAARLGVPVQPGGSHISYDLWSQLRRLVDWLASNWQQADEGIWEVRGGRQQFVHSKLMCWVAFDRALRLARDSALPCDARRWESSRDEIYEDIMLHGYSKERAAFVQHYGSQSLDASNLLMPLVGFIASRDPRMLSTLAETQRELVSDSLVYRYDPELAAADGLEGREGTFSMCSFWYVECLARTGRLDDARLTLEKMLTYANHLGLYAEEIGPSGEALGNFPQAFTHLALISAASHLDRLLDGRTTR